LFLENPITFAGVHHASEHVALFAARASAGGARVLDITTSIDFRLIARVGAAATR
jgi:hypothetical protein